MEMETERMATCYKIDRGFVEDIGREERANAGFQLHLEHFILYPDRLKESEGEWTAPLWALLFVTNLVLFFSHWFAEK